ncbi:hypothetical protein BD309DRAFT_628896 [Dichomitus squalens]|nr:hypothetical protein BD309DRAFT_628896 [Dichomitus squalens]
MWFSKRPVLAFSAGSLQVSDLYGHPRAPVLQLMSQKALSRFETERSKMPTRTQATAQPSSTCLPADWFSHGGNDIPLVHPVKNSESTDHLERHTLAASWSVGPRKPLTAGISMLASRLTSNEMKLLQSPELPKLRINVMYVYLPITNSRR